MQKSLSEMSLEELWQLFPIILTEHQTYWEDWYVEEAKRLEDILYENEKRMYHIGSTAINNIWAKPIIDILIEIPQTLSMEKIKNILVQNGYICMSESEHRKSFNKGYTEDGFAERVYHLHLRFYGDNDELYFRDYMNDYPEAAAEYEKLKHSLWKTYEHDRDAYTNAKSEFILNYTALAKKHYGQRYSCT